MGLRNLRHSCMGIARVLMAALAVISSNAFAALFEPTPPQQLVAGKTLSVVLRLSSESTQQPDVSIVDPTVNMTLIRMTKDKYLLRWDSPDILPAEQIITVKASVSASPAQVERHHIVVRSNQSLDSGPSSPAITVADSHLSSLETSTRTKPIIKGISTQIISAGQTVMFRVFAPIENGRNADVSIDQLPPDARLDIGIDGVPMFIWKTASTDRGEHRFLFTATHPSMASLQDTAEAVVIVEYANASETGGSAEASNMPETSDEQTYPEETPDSEIGITSQGDDGIAPEGAEDFTDSYQPPNDYPTDSPSDFPPDSPSDYYPTDSPPNDFIIESPPESLTDGPPDVPTDRPDNDAEPGTSLPPPDSQ